MNDEMIDAEVEQEQDQSPETVENESPVATPVEDRPPEKDEPDGPSDSILKKIANGLKGMVGKDDEDAETATEAEKEDGASGDTIPDAFVNAARETGWDDKQIAEFASDYSDEELVEMIPFLAVEEEGIEEVEVGDVEPEQEETPTEKTEREQELEARIAELEKKLQIDEQSAQVRQVKEQIAKIDKVFDKLGEEMEVFGKTSDLPRFPEGTPKAGQYIPSHPAVKARQQVWSDAVRFHKLGDSWDDAIDSAVALYKGRHLEAQIQNKLVRQLKRSEKRLSARRSAPKATEKVYDSEEDRRIAVVRAAARNAGFELDE